MAIAKLYQNNKTEMSIFVRFWQLYLIYCKIYKIEQ